MPPPDADGTACALCGEPVHAWEAAAMRVNDGPVHWCCALRLVVGSVAHLEHRCSCYLPGSTAHDPPGVTRRQAAEAAARLWAQQQAATDTPIDTTEGETDA